MQELDQENKSSLFSFIGAEWLRKWVEFVQKGADQPPAITNRSLFLDGKLKTNLVLSRDYVVIYKSQYDYLHSIYGGELPLTSSQKDIYTTEKQTPSLPQIGGERRASMQKPPLPKREEGPSANPYHRRNFGSLEHKFSREKLGASSKLEGGRDTSAAESSIIDPYDVPSKSLKISSSFVEESTASSQSESRIMSKARNAAGFYNPSNYCFMNAALQCLFSITPFADYFLSKAFLRDAVNRTRFSDALSKVAYSYFNESGTVRPEGLWNLCGTKFPGGRQHDLPEFLRFILEELESELRKSRVTEMTWENYERYYNRMLVNTFGGQTVQDVTCKKCQHVSKSYEIFTDIALDLSSSVESSLRRYTASEDIDTDYRCENCKRVTGIKKQTRFLRLPNYLILQIKRFESGPYPKKSNAIMRFNNSMVIEGDHETAQYQLIAVAVHSGSLGGGHYIAYGKRDRSWYCFNDCNLSQVSQSQVTEAQAYLLIYMK